MKNHEGDALTPRAEERRALAYLRHLLADTDLSQRDVEERVGWTRGYLSRLLNGHVGLRVRHLEVLLDVLGVSPARCFRELYGPGPRFRERPALEAEGDASRVLSYGIRRIRELGYRLERFEAAIERLAKSAALHRRISAGGSRARRAGRG